MRVRVVRFQSANPVVAAILAMLLLALVVAVLLAGATLLAGVAVVGGVVGGATLLARRVLRLGRRSAAEPPHAARELPTLDPANEIFPAGQAQGEERRLPPAR